MNADGIIDLRFMGGASPSSTFYNNKVFNKEYGGNTNSMMQMGGSLVPRRSHRMVTACAQTKEIAALFQQGTDPFVSANECAADCAVVALAQSIGCVLSWPWPRASKKASACL